MSHYQPKPTIKNRLPAEWESQKTVLFAYPHLATDWAPNLTQTIQCYNKIIQTISHFQSITLLCSTETDINVIAQTLHSQTNPSQTNTEIAPNFTNIHCLKVPFNDTWIRDYGPITLEHSITTEKVTNTETTIKDSSTHNKLQPRIIDFTFNGWGSKFLATLDNQVTRTLAKQDYWKKLHQCETILESHDLVLEGGSIDSDGAGSILTTRHCLSSPNRNPTLSYQTIIDQLKTVLGAEQVLSLSSGYLQGDDTDGHIDTLARFCSPTQIVYQGCQQVNDIHYQPLQEMAQELRTFRDLAGNAYQLYELPLPDPKLNTDGQRLPASYANFLIINDAVIVPTYQDPNDAQALAILKTCFPERRVIGIDCSALIQQGGSLHCCSMQVPIISSE